VTATIPAAIAALPDLNLLEKATLAYIANFPACSNAKLAKLTGLSERGVESMLARLRKDGLLRKSGEGKARRHDLTFAVVDHVECGNTNAADSHKNCERGKAGNSECLVVCKQEETIQDFVDRHLAFY